MILLAEMSLTADAVAIVLALLAVARAIVYFWPRPKVATVSDFLSMRMGDLSREATAFVLYAYSKHNMLDTNDAELGDKIENFWEALGELGSGGWVSHVNDGLYMLTPKAVGYCGDWYRIREGIRDAI